MNTLNQEGETPLTAALKIKDFHFAENICQDERCDLNGANEAGELPLYLAVSNEAKIGLLEIMIKMGADVNFPNADGMTPLYKAIEMKDEAIASFLVQKNYHPKMWYYKGKLPEHLVKDSILSTKLRCFENADNMPSFDS